MRCLPLLLPLLLWACASAGKETGTTTGQADADTDADGDTDADADADTDAETTPDTAYRYAYYEGSAAKKGGDWSGSESFVVTDIDAAEICRVTNPYSGPALTDLCPGCEFGFDITFAAGTMSGAGCDALHFTADQADGSEYLYGWAPSFYYAGYGYYENVLFFDYGGWYPFAYGYPNEQNTALDYRGWYLYYVYYYYG